MADAEQDLSFRTRSLESIKLLGLAVRLVWRVGPLLLVGLFLLLVVQSVIPVAQLQFTQRAVDALTGERSVDDHVAAVLWLTLLAAALLITILIGPLSGLVQAVIGDRLTARVTRSVLVACNTWKGLHRFEDPAFVDDLNVARTQSGRALDVVGYGSRFVVDLISCIGIAVTLGGLHPLVPVLLIAAHVPGMTTYWRFNHQIGSLLYVLTPKARRLEYYRGVSIAATEAKDIRLAGAHPYLRRRYGEDWEASFGDVSTERRRLVPAVIGGDLLGGLALAMAYAYLIWATARGDVGIGGLVMFSAAAIMLRGRLNMIGFDLGFLPFAMSFLPSVQRVLDADADLGSAAAPVPLPESFTQGIAFDNVHFSYPGQEEETLRGVSFRISPGESVALVGGNGAGKTTIVKLLLRLYDPTSGRITVDGIDLRDLDVDEVRRRIGVIFQDFGRYELSARENIGLGDIRRINDRAKIMEAAQRGGAGNLVTQLPDGLDTALGRELGDRELSGGQWQRIALSRAFMRDSELLVLDEPTAELDPRGEHEVFQRFTELTTNRMTILVSHRFSTVRMADRILVLDHGVVRESGSHTDLIGLGGEYARMFRLQAAQYVDVLPDAGGAADHAWTDQGEVAP